MVYNLGKMKRVVDLRSVWPHEANDFTKWLSEESNLAILGESVGIDISLEERESSVGAFNVDLYATEAGTGRKIIIENQLEDTNHDHLGKLITYASGKGAEIVIWIVRRARDEHRQAIEWLNAHTDSDLGFFLVEIELWQIDNSLIAPKFNVVEKPNDWAKTMKAVEGMSEVDKLKLEFWQTFVETMHGNQEYESNFTFRKPAPQHWYTLSVGSSSYHVSLLVNSLKRTIGAEIYINDDKPAFEMFRRNESIFKETFPEAIEWIEAKKACRIVVCKSLDIRKRGDWDKAFGWFLEKALSFKKIIKEIDR